MFNALSLKSDLICTPMSCSWKNCFSVFGSNETTVRSKTHKRIYGFCPSNHSLQSTNSKSRYMGKPITLSDQKGLREWSVQSPTNFFVHAQSSICVSRAMRWWEKTLKPNMMEIYSAQELVESLLNAGDKLVIVDFYSPGCGGCKALHPKICQMAESNPNAIFLQVNYEELKTMCYSLHIHVLPFFKFYRGAEGRVCSFSCTNATIKKFKDALVKHGTDRCNLGPAKGLDESELLSLASAGVRSMNLPLQSSREKRMEDLVIEGIDISSSLSKAGNKMELKEDNAILMA